MPSADQDIVERLKQLDTPSVSDALDNLGLSGRVTHLKRLATEQRIAGRVLTTKLGTAEVLDGPVRHLCTAAVEAAEPGDIIVIEQRSGLEAAGWGGILSNGAKYRQVAGIICDGPVRDIDESRALGFPVFADHAVPKQPGAGSWKKHSTNRFKLEMSRSHPATTYLPTDRVSVS